tara:strand:- start:224 stop:1492 length:1269 start_codon:yes stop_codon:yes gene_type:complete
VFSSSFKKFLIFSVIIFCFSYGVSVGVYKLFPYKIIKYVQDVLSGDIRLEAEVKAKAEAEAKAKAEAEAKAKAEAEAKAKAKAKAEAEAKAKAEAYERQWTKLIYKNISFNGLVGFSEDGDFSRLPNRISDKLRNPLKQLEKHTAGGVAKFKTTSSKLRIVAKFSSIRRAHMNDIITNGVDIYVNGRYHKSIFSNKAKFDKEIIIPVIGEKKIDVYFPLYGHVKDINFYVEVDAASRIADSEKKTIVFYGSSITQGCCASNPSMSFPAIISRKLEVNQVNLGFSGNGLGDLELAEFIAELNPDIIVLDYWANPDPQSYKETLPLFIKKIRSKQKKIVILVTSTFSNPGREKYQRLKDEISKQTVKFFKDEKDNYIYFIDELLKEDETSGLIDGRHLNSYGFSIVAERLTNFIKKNNLLNPKN